MHLLCRVHHSQLTALTRERYVTIFTKIALALLEEDEREDPDKALQECRDLANEAWESDAKGADTLRSIPSLLQLSNDAQQQHPNGNSLPVSPSKPRTPSIGPLRRAFSPKLALAGSVPATERDGLLIMV